MSINSAYLKSYPGLLKLAQLIAGIIVVILTSIKISSSKSYIRIPFNWELFFFATAVTFLIATFILILSNISTFRSNEISATSYVS